MNVLLCFVQLLFQQFDLVLHGLALLLKGPKKHEHTSISQNALSMKPQYWSQEEQQKEQLEEQQEEQQLGTLTII